MTRLKRLVGITGLALHGVAQPLWAASPLGTAFTYQGQLQQNGAPASGTANLVFTLWDAPGIGNPPAGGLQIGQPVNKPNTPLSQGNFTVQLNQNAATEFGVNAFNGDARWLQISVNGTPLAPRQSLTAAPYALGIRLPLSETVATPATTTPAVQIVDKGIGGAARFEIDNPASSATALRATTDGTGPGLVVIGKTSDHVPNSLASGAMLIGSNDDPFTYMYLDNDDIDCWYSVYGLSDDRDLHLQRHSAGNVYLAAGGGRVGIGAAVADFKLDVSDRMRVREGSSGSAGIWLAQAIGFAYSNRAFVGMHSDSRVGLYGNTGAGWAFEMDTTSGGVAIGTTNIPAGVKLAVNGKVLCEELEVQLSQDWPDYVFADEYNLMPLDDVDAFVKEHKHLPDVPSAAQTKADGVNVGQMQATLLRKVEELTLHMIELNKRLDSVQRENEQFRAKLRSYSAESR